MNAAVDRAFWLGVWVVIGTVFVASFLPFLISLIVIFGVVGWVGHEVKHPGSEIARWLNRP